MTSHVIVRTAVELLPMDDVRRESILNEYFRDLLPTASFAKDHWEIVLERPSDACVYVDPNLATGLRWWGNLQVSEVFLAYRRCRGFFMSLHDCWSLLSWSEWMQRRIDQAGEKPSRVTILHVDDHTDFMSPLLKTCGNEVTDMITDSAVRMSDPESVRRAIQSGAIGVGSFIAPFLHEFDGVTFLHLVQSTHRHAGDVSNILLASNTPDTLLSPKDHRPTLVLRESQSVDGRGREIGEYIRATRLESLLEHYNGGPILLHVDLDVFNNRFDGDSDWQQHDSRHDPPIGKVLQAINELFEGIASHRESKNIENITIALSPGFFPAELWEPSIEAVKRSVNTFGTETASE